METKDLDQMAASMVVLAWQTPLITRLSALMLEAISLCDLLPPVQKPFNGGLRYFAHEFRRASDALAEREALLKNGCISPSFDVCLPRRIVRAIYSLRRDDSDWSTYLQTHYLPTTPVCWRKLLKPEEGGFEYSFDR